MGRNTTVVSRDTWLPQAPEQVFNAVMSPETNGLGRAISGLAAGLLERTIEDQHHTLAAWLAAHAPEAELARL